jgi:hypothetical protein
MVVGLGVVLIIVGLLFSLTIIGAVIGIPMMAIGGGLVFWGLVLGRKTVITNVVQVSNSPGMPGNHFSTHDDQAPARYLDRDPPIMRPAMREVNPPRVALESLHRTLTADSTIEHVRPEPTNRYSYDRAKWNALVEYDPDIARIAAALKPYGEKYTDQFASAYLAINDKSYLERWSRLSEQNLRVDKWSVCRG